MDMSKAQTGLGMYRPTCVTLLHAFCKLYVRLLSGVVYP